METKSRPPRASKIIFSVALTLSVPQWSAADASEDRSRGRHKGMVKNLPAIEPVPLENLTVDQEFNWYAGAGFSNTTVDYGLAKNWNIGVSFLSAQFYSIGSAAQPFQPEVLFNLEKHFQPTAYSAVVIGTQTGAGITSQGSVLIDYSYMDYQWSWSRWNTDIDFGGYYANAALAGAESVGWHVKLEWPLGKGLRMDGDYVSGRSSVGGTTLRLLYPLAAAIKLGIGVQIPAAGSGNDFSGLLGVYWH
jgi:hypothetical protein